MYSKKIYPMDTVNMDDHIKELRKALQILIARQEQPGLKSGNFYCPWCKTERPLTSGALHEWMFKRSANAPDDITFSQKNCIILCQEPCHSQHGQTKRMFFVCLEWKMKFFDPFNWVQGLLDSGRIKHWPVSFDRRRDEK